MSFIFEKVLPFLFANWPSAIPAGIVAIIGYFYYRNKIRNIEKSIESNTKILKDYVENEGSTQRNLNMLIVEWILDGIKSNSKKAKQLSKRLFEIGEPWARQTIEAEEKRGNPLSHEEIERLRKYMDMFKNDMPFTTEQAQDFDSLAKRLRNDPPRESSPWGTFIIGLIAGVILGNLLSGD